MNEESVRAVARAMCCPPSGCEATRVDYGQCYEKGHYQAARYALTAIEQAGYAVMPREPTEAMIRAGDEFDAYHSCVDIYRTMLAAAERDDEPV